MAKALADRTIIVDGACCLRIGLGRNGPALEPSRCLRLPSPQRWTNWTAGCDRQRTSRVDPSASCTSTAAAFRGRPVRPYRVPPRDERRYGTERGHRGELPLGTGPGGRIHHCGLLWDAATMAPIFLSAVLDHAALDDGLAHAARPNDLLPRRPFDQLPQRVASQLVEWVDGRLQDGDYSVEPADIYRVPKSAFTTRPAALLALPDRVALEALAGMISARLDDVLPDEVVWPRSRRGSHTDMANIDYRSRPLQWESKYIVKADIADFYGSVDHAYWGSSHPPISRCRENTAKRWRVC